MIEKKLKLLNYMKEHNLKIQYMCLDVRYKQKGDMSEFKPSSLFHYFDFHKSMHHSDSVFNPMVLEIREYDESKQILDYRLECYLFVSPIFRYSRVVGTKRPGIINISYNKLPDMPLSLDKDDPFFEGITPGFTSPKVGWLIGEVYHFEAVARESNLEEFWKWYTQEPIKKGKEIQDDWMGRYFDFLNPGMFFFSGNLNLEDYVQAWFEKWVWEGESCALMEVDLSRNAVKARGSPECKKYLDQLERSLTKSFDEYLRTGRI